MFIADTTTWYLERLIRLFAGIFVLGGTFLGYFVDQDWFKFTGFVGTIFTIFALTGFRLVSIMVTLCWRAGALQVLVWSDPLLERSSHQCRFMNTYAKRVIKSSCFCSP